MREEKVKRVNADGYSRKFGQEEERGHKQTGMRDCFLNDEMSNILLYRGENLQKAKR